MHSECVDVPSVRRLIGDSQKALILFNHDGLMPLHAALLCGTLCTVELATLLLGDSHHTARIIQHRLQNRRTALMQALFFRANIQMLDYLLSFYSPGDDIFIECDDRQQTALHIALNNGVPLGIAARLIDEHKKVLTLFDDRNRAPVHVAFNCGVHLPELFLFVDEAQTLLKITPYEQGTILLHMVVTHTRPDHYPALISNIGMLIDTDKTVLLLREQTIQGMPLHLLLLNAPFNLILLAHVQLCKLIDDKKEVLCAKSVSGSTPLHIFVKRIALASNSPQVPALLCVIKLLIDPTESVLEFENSKGLTPYQIFKQGICSSSPNEGYNIILEGLTPKTMDI